MALADDERRRTAFGTVVDPERYDDLRPGYPTEAVRWLVGGPDRPLTVLDLAAGTGKLTRVLRSLGHEVLAVDPSPSMLEALARTTDDGVRVHLGTAEDLPLPDASVDAVTVGQGWHWVRPGAAAAEVARVLRPGGVLGLAWNTGDLAVPWGAAFERLVEGSGFAEGLWQGGADGSEQELWWPRVPDPLVGAERTSFPAPLRLPSPQAVADVASTYAGVAVREDRDDVLERVRALAASAAGPDGSVVLPLVCHCFRYRRP